MHWGEQECQLLEARSAIRHEFLDGEVFARLGAGAVGNPAAAQGSPFRSKEAHLALPLDEGHSEGLGPAPSVGEGAAAEPLLVLVLAGVYVGGASLEEMLLPVVEEESVRCRAAR